MLKTKIQIQGCTHFNIICMCICHTILFGGWGTVLTTGTNLSNGQNRSQVIGSDRQPEHLKDVAQGTLEWGEKKSSVDVSLYYMLISVLCYKTEN